MFKLYVGNRLRIAACVFGLLALAALQVIRARPVLCADGLKRPILMAHRGGDVEADENTLKSYALAAKYGMDYIECDPRLTKDGVFVIMHDAGVERTTSGKGKIEDMTLAEVKALRTKHGESVPTLDEVFALAKEKKVRVYLDTKLLTAPDMEKLTDRVVKAGMSDRVMVGLWATEQLKWMEKNHPEMLTTIPYPTPISSLKQAKKLGADWVGTVIEQATPVMIAKAEAAGLKVVTFPINDRETIMKKINEGMQVIQTDDPKLLQAVVKEMGLGE